MKNTTIGWVALAIVVLGGGYWWVSMPGTGDAGKATVPMPPVSDTKPIDTKPVLVDKTGEAMTGKATLEVAHDATLGDYLVAANGMTLYLYTKDTTGVTNCYDQCAVNWPPYMAVTNATPTTGTGVTGAITMITRNDGTKQLAYKGVPLYYWKNDVKPGDTTGQNVGGVWFVVKP